MEEEEEEEERRWHGGQTLRGTQLPRAGVAGVSGGLGGTEPWVFAEAGGQSPPLPSGEEGVVTPQAPFSMHLSRPTKVPSSLLHCFISIPATTTFYFSEMK